MNELESCVNELQHAAKSLSEAADRLASICRSNAYAPEKQNQPEETVLASKPVALEQVRAVLAEKSRSGHTADVRALLEKHGADKLSAIDPIMYATLLSEAEVLGNG